MKEEPAILIPKIEPDKLEVVTKPKSKLKIKFFVIPSVILLIIFLLLLPILLFGARANKAYKQILPIVENINIEDTNKLKSCIDSGKYDSRLTSDTQLASSIGVSGTPGFFVNDTNFAGAYSFKDMESIATSALK